MAGNHEKSEWVGVTSDEELWKFCVCAKAPYWTRNLDSILKSRDITLPTKVRIVKATVFPAVMYGSESWAIKKADRRRIDAFEL